MSPQICNKLVRIDQNLNYEIDFDSSLGEDYVLEVSTPGIERRFFKQDQLLEYLGEDLKVKLREPLEGVKNINGTLVDCNENFFLLESLTKGTAKYLL